MLNPPAAYADRPCTSYDKLTAAISELAKSDKVDPKVRFYASETDYVLKHNPKTAKLLEEAVSNSTCGDLAQIAESFSAVARDIAVAEGAIQLRSLRI